MPTKQVDLPTSFEPRLGSLATFVRTDLWAPQLLFMAPLESTIHLLT